MNISRKLAKLARVTLAIARFLSTGCKSSPSPPPLSPPPLSPPHLPSPPPCLPPTFPPSLPPPSSQVRLRPVVALWHAVSVAYLAAALAHSHSHCLTVSLSLSLSLISLISLISFSSLSSLSLSLSLSLSSLSLVFPSLFSLFSRRRIRAKSHISRKLAKLAGVTLAIARFLSTGCKS